MDKPRLGFLGTGWIGRHRLEAIAKSGVAEIELVYDPVPELLSEALRLAPEARAAKSYDEISRSEVDGVVIATPSAAHSEQSLLAIEAGKAVFCQKPLGRNAREARQVVRRAREKDLLLGVDFSYRYTEAMQKIRNLIREDAIGNVYAIDLVFHNAYGPDKPWFYVRELAGGGCLIDLGVHLVDLALWISGFSPVRARSVSGSLFASGVPISKNPDAVEDFAAASFELESGTAVRIACSWKLSAGCDCVISADFHGERGGLSMKNRNGSFYDFAAELYRGTSRELLIEPPDEWGGRAAVAWAKRLGRSKKFDSESESIVQVAEALDLIYLDAR